MSHSVSARALPRLGTACDECRRRKQRCDGQQPACRVCQESGLICRTTQRGTRGPKKGYIKALKDRVSELEALLQSHVSTKQQQVEQPRESNSEGLCDMILPTPSTGLSDEPLNNDIPFWLPEMTENAEAFTGHLAELTSASMLSLTSSNYPQITSMMHAELYDSPLKSCFYRALLLTFAGINSISIVCIRLYPSSIRDDTYLGPRHLTRPHHVFAFNILHGH